MIASEYYMTGDRTSIMDWCLVVSGHLAIVLNFL
ncbi:Uncharacterised protein [Vibrio cholerae]|nr:Uncharacterised protein [Vibrio cholerae]